MATIKLNSIHCERLQDAISEDEIELRVAGTAVAGPLGVHKDGTVTLGGISRTFTGTVSVQLVELDGNHTPVLGAKATQQVSGEGRKVACTCRSSSSPRRYPSARARLTEQTCAVLVARNLWNGQLTTTTSAPSRRGA
jgi:hypothetical protein